MYVKRNAKVLFECAVEGYEEKVHNDNDDNREDQVNENEETDTTRMLF